MKLRFVCAAFFALLYRCSLSLDSSSNLTILLLVACLDDIGPSKSFNMANDEGGSGGLSASTSFAQRYMQRKYTHQKKTAQSEEALSHSFNLLRSIIRSYTPSLAPSGVATSSPFCKYRDSSSSALGLGPCPSTDTISYTSKTAPMRQAKVKVSSATEEIPTFRCVRMLSYVRCMLSSDNPGLSRRPMSYGDRSNLAK